MRRTALVILAVTIASCGSQDRSATTTDRGSSGVRPVVGSPFGRHDAPPTGVRHQIEYFGAGDAICGAVESGEHIDLDRRPLYQFQTSHTAVERPEIGETLYICPRGLSTAQPVEITVRAAHGRTVRSQLPAAREEERYLRLFIDGRWPVGPASITAKQGHRVLQKQVIVEPPHHAGARSDTELGRVPTPTLHLMVVGQRRNQPVYVDIYRAERATYSYVTSLRFDVDDRGIGERLVRTAPAHGSYVLRPRPADLRDLDAEDFVQLCASGCASP
jgi:hypothetical protein